MNAIPLRRSSTSQMPSANNLACHLSCRHPYEEAAPFPRDSGDVESRHGCAWELSREPRRQGPRTTCQASGSLLAHISTRTVRTRPTPGHPPLNPEPLGSFRRPHGLPEATYSRQNLCRAFRPAKRPGRDSGHLRTLRSTTEGNSFLEISRPPCPRVGNHSAPKMCDVTFFLGTIVRPRSNCTPSSSSPHCYRRYTCMIAPRSPQQTFDLAMSSP